MSRGTITHAAAVVGLTAALALAPQAARADEVKVGILGSFSGPYADWGKRFQQSVDLFVEQHNGKVGNHDIKIIYRDVGGNNPARAKQLAQELVVRDQVHFLAGLEFTPTVLSVADVITQAKIPFVIFNSATSDVVRKSPFYVRVGYTQWQICKPAAEYAYEHGSRKAVIIVADYAPGHDTIDAYTKVFTDLGGKIIDVIKVPLDTPDFSSYIQRIRDDKPDTLFTFMPGGPMALNLIKGYTDSGLRADGVRYIGGGELEEPFLPTVGDAALGLVSASFYSPYLDNPTNKQWLIALHKKYGPDLIPNVATVFSWDGMQVLYHMIEATDGKLDGEKAIASVEGYKWDSPRGPVEIDAKTRDIIENIYIRKVEKVDGKLGDITIATYPHVKDPWKELHPE
jgi:branched-chain amino acid transport system substrate-binding protein